MVGAGGVRRRRRPDVSRSRSRPTIPFRRTRWEYFGAKFDWIHDGKIGAIVPRGYVIKRHREAVARRGAVV